MITESITVINNTSKPITIVTVLDKLVVADDRHHKYRIDPKEPMTIFTDRVISIRWDK